MLDLSIVLADEDPFATMSSKVFLSASDSSITYFTDGMMISSSTRISYTKAIFYARISCYKTLVGTGFPLLS